MNDQAKDGDAGFGPYSVIHNEDDGFYYVVRYGQLAGGAWALRKGALRKARELNGSEARAPAFVPEGEGDPTVAEDGTPYGILGEDFSYDAEPSGQDPEWALKGPDGESILEELEPVAPDASSAARHAWVEDAARFAAETLRAKTGLDVPVAIRVSLGWPLFGRAAIGECWYFAASGDGHREVFVSPELDDGALIVDVLIHELIHASLPDGEGHGKNFGRAARAVGLEGKLTATNAGPELLADIQAWVATRGEYPAKGLLRANMKRKTQTTRLLKVSCCNEHEPYVVRMSLGQYERAAPVCGICGEDMQREDAE